MVFSSNLFLFFFLPTFLLLYFAAPIAARNAVLLVASLLFYAFGSGVLAWILVTSILLNHAAARVIAAGPPGLRGPVFAAAVVLNLLPLLYYKYFAFSVQTLWAAGLPIPVDAALIAGIALPIGISFYTFQGISYIADVYRGAVPPARSTLEFGMYHTLFPQLVAGPIVRYVEIRREIDARRFDLSAMAEGACRFCIGLGKKVILADNLAPIVDQIFGLPAAEQTAALCWLAMLCFSLQIYLDFSGYSDMAIGLGRMLGFTFPENFDQPYRARSVTEFWRRWHMTLTRWFRDYVYIPLGGNRHGELRTYANLCIIFVLCGLWHGASLTFLVWGLYHGLLLTLERVLRSSWGVMPSGLFGMPGTGLLVLVGWVPFRATSLTEAGHVLKTMFGFGQGEAVFYSLDYFLSGKHVAYIVLALLVALVPYERMSFVNSASVVVRAGRMTGAGALFLLAVAMLSANSFRPFIYFQF
jgi:alginate O-acetyltransferase complex protein AlgI